jgi:hypothetical protein
MVVGRAARHIGVEGQAKIGRGVMAAHGLARALGRRDLGQHLGIAVDHAGEVHHLAQADDARPGHRLGHIVRADLAHRSFPAPGALGTQDGICTKTLTGRHQRLVVHQPHAGQAQHIGDLVRVDEHRGGAVRDDGAGEFGDGHHAALDMHVAVAQSPEPCSGLRPR